MGGGSSSSSSQATASTREEVKLQEAVQQIPTSEIEGFAMHVKNHDAHATAPPKMKEILETKFRLYRPTSEMLNKIYDEYIDIVTNIVHSAEDVQFLCAVHELKVARSNLPQKMMLVYNKYIKSGAEHHINFSGGFFTAFDTSAAKGDEFTQTSTDPNSDPWDAAEHAAFWLISGNFIQAGITNSIVNKLHLKRGGGTTATARNEYYNQLLDGEYYDYSDQYYQMDSGYYGNVYDKKYIGNGQNYYKGNETNHGLILDPMVILMIVMVVMICLCFVCVALIISCVSGYVIVRYKKQSIDSKNKYESVAVNDNDV